MTGAARPPIVLRPWAPQDRASVLEIFSGTDDLATQYSQPVTSLEDADDVLTGMLVGDADTRNFAITVDGRPVGNVGVSAVDRRHDTGWMSYFSAGAVRGRGLVTRSAIAVANWALAAGTSREGSGAATDTDLAAGLGLYRLELGHRANNPVSGRIVVAAGFLQEGREREKLRYGTGRFDTLVHGRLATDPTPVAVDVTLEI